MNRRSRPSANTAHRPSDSTRAVVTALAGLGEEAEAIARHLGISERDLRSLYGDELRHGPERLRQKLSLSLIKDALAGKDNKGRLRLAEKLGILERGAPRPLPMGHAALPPPGQRHMSMTIGDEESRARLVCDEEQAVFVNDGSKWVQVAG